MSEFRKAVARAVPRWMTVYFRLNLPRRTEIATRRAFVFNVFSFCAAAACGLYAVMYLSMDRAFWPAALLSASVGAAVFLPGPLYFRISPATGVYAVCLGAAALLLWQSRMFGLEAGLFFFFLTLAPFSLAVLGIERRRDLAGSVALSIGALLYTVFTVEGPTLPGADEPVFQAVMMTATIFAAVGLVLLPGFLAHAQAEAAEKALAREFARSEALLLNLLPRPIVERLKAAPDQTIADQIEQATFVFADIVGFTPRSSSMQPHALVRLLNRIFSVFDELAVKHGMEKIKTIGDAYMVAAGLPAPRPDHAAAAAEMALDMLEAMQRLSAETGEEIAIRIGIHSGPAIAGVIGTEKVFYDVWGDAVNTASRLESSGEAGQIHLTGETRVLLDERFVVSPRGVVDIKGKGPIETWWLQRAAR